MSPDWSTLARAQIIGAIDKLASYEASYHRLVKISQRHLATCFIVPSRYFLHFFLLLSFVCLKDILYLASSITFDQ